MPMEFDGQDIKRLDSCIDATAQSMKKIGTLTVELTEEVSKFGMDKVTNSAKALEATNEDVIMPVLKEAIETFEKLQTAIKTIHTAVGTDY